MASPKRPRENASVMETPTAKTLPADLMLEIVARSDLGALVRCAASSKLLRRDILTPAFIRRVSCQGVAPCILVHLCTYGKRSPAPVYPVTHKAASFCDDYLAPFLSHNTAGLFNNYTILRSRRGLILLERKSIKDRPKSDDLCVYDPMRGTRKFLSKPPEISPDEYVLLTAADGIDCSSFLLLVIERCRWSIKVQTASSCGTWGPVADVCRDKHAHWLLKNPCNAAVLRGGVIHWLEYGHEKIVNYDVGNGKLGVVKLPPTCCSVNQLHLATSSDGKLLKLLAIERFTMYVWLQLPVSASGGSDWSLDVVINMEEKLRLLFTDIADGLDDPVEFEGSSNRSGEVVFLKVCRQCCSNAFFAFDLETKEVHMQNRRFSLLEIDLPSRLQTMKIFS